MKQQQQRIVKREPAKIYHQCLVCFAEADLVLVIESDDHTTTIALCYEDAERIRMALS